MKQGLPVSLSLLEALSVQLDKVHVFLKPESTEHALLKSIIQESDRVTDDARFLDSPDCIRYFQVALLMGMSMFGGVQVTCLTSFDANDMGVRITWDSGSSDSFSWGVCDEGFKRFFKYYQDRLSSVPQHRDYLPADILQGVFGFLKSYLLILKSTESQISKLITTKQALKQLLDDDLNRDLLFIVLSSLPSAELNHLFLTIHQYFPQDMDISTPDGRTMNIHSFFEQGANDVFYLIEKTRVYLDLYFLSSMPIIKEITRKQTTSYLSKLLDNDQVFKETQQHLMALKQGQLYTRTKLYTVFKDHLEAVI